MAAPLWHLEVNGHAEELFDCLFAVSTVLIIYPQLVYFPNLDFIKCNQKSNAQTELHQSVFFLSS